MTTRLGIVAFNGGVYFHHEDIFECREFLRSSGFDVDPARGWSKPGWLGMIEYSKRTRGWYATYWRTAS